MKTFVFFVGGTGARVMRSLTMLLASGVNIGQSNSIVPILIDYDVDNADKNDSDAIIKSYLDLQKLANYDYTQTGDQGGFFYSRMEGYRVFDMRTDSKEGQTFGDKIGYKSILSVREEGTSKYENYYKFLRSLYNDDKQDPPTEINLNLDRGFKGNPNIGTVVFKEFLDSPEYKRLEFSSGDRFFVVGSIFGGTGSSCLPKIVEDMRTCNMPARKTAVGGACVVLPYYSLPHSDISSVKSESFKSKTKAALDYYDQELNKKLEAAYYIGYDDIEAPYGSNVDGGKDQHNPAHLVEVLSAMSVVDFISKDFSYGDSTKFFEYSINSGLGENGKLPAVANLDIFGADIDNDVLVQKYASNLCAFALFCSFYRKFISNGEDFKTGFLKKAPAYITKVGDKIKLDSSFGQIFGVDKTGFAMMFETWADELAANPALHFKPFDFDTDIDNVICKTVEKKRYKNLTGTIRETLSVIFDSIESKNKNINNDAKFIRMAYDACRKAVYEVYGNGTIENYSPIN